MNRGLLSGSDETTALFCDWLVKLDTASSEEELGWVHRGRIWQRSAAAVVDAIIGIRSSSYHSLAPCWSSVPLDSTDTTARRKCGEGAGKQRAASYSEPAANQQRTRSGY